MNRRPKRYEDLVRLLEAEIERLEAEPAAVCVRQWLAAISGDDRDGRAAGACRLYSKTGRWPAGLRDATRLEVSLRLRCARWHCLELAEVRCDGRGAGEILADLTVEYWDDVGRRDWMLECVLGADGFLEEE